MPHSAKIATTIGDYLFNRQADGDQEISGKLDGMALGLKACFV
jgi:hypothetical protein